MGKNSRGKAEKQSSQANGKSSVAAGAAQNGKATAKRSRGNSAENKSEVPVKRQLFGSWVSNGYKTFHAMYQIYLVIYKMLRIHQRLERRQSVYFTNTVKKWVGKNHSLERCEISLHSKINHFPWPKKTLSDEKSQGLPMSNHNWKGRQKNQRKNNLLVVSLWHVLRR